jgi:hypothetical protein
MFMIREAISKEFRRKKPGHGMSYAVMDEFVGGNTPERLGKFINLSGEGGLV